MRFTTAIYFQRVTEGDYNANTGDYNADKVTEVKRYASVTNSKTDTIKLVYGDLKQGSLTIHLQQPYRETFNFIRIGEKRIKLICQGVVKLSL
jgi:hypothetical protein